MAIERYFLKLSYKGTNYNGWQIQPNAKTVQGEINDTLTKLNSGIEVLSMGCGRTDTGVHATDFYAHFDFKEIQDIEQFLYKMNNMLPSDIVIHQIIKVQQDAHARYDAKMRTYQYFISTQKNAFNFDTTLLFSQKLNIEKMNQACEILMTYSNFESFSKVKTAVKTFECEVTYALWKQDDKGFVFTITANRFLRNMVRSIVGTMLDIGTEKIVVEELHQIIKSKNRDKAGKSVLSNGLFLTRIEYDYI